MNKKSMFKIHKNIDVNYSEKEEAWNRIMKNREIMLKELNKFRLSINEAKDANIKFAKAILDNKEVNIKFIQILNK